RNGSKRAQVSITQEAFEQLVAKADATSIISIPVHLAADDVELELSSDMLQRLADKQLSLELSSESGIYRIAAVQIIAALSDEQLAQLADGRSGTIYISINKPSQAEQALINEAIANKKVELVGEAVQFAVEVGLAGKRQHLTNFGSYVERM